MTSSRHDPHIQVAALCWRSDPLMEMLLVTSLRTRRWIVPKGWPQEGLSLAQSAAAEAQEEAGVHGIVSAEPIGHYHYIKAKAGIGHPCRVHVFSLRVTEQQPVWPEKAARKRLWLSFQQAAHRIAEPDLRRLILGFARLAKAA